MSHRHAALFLLAYASGVAAWGYCNDNDVSCANWAKNGECEGKNKDFMKSSGIRGGTSDRAYNSKEVVGDRIKAAAKDAKERGRI